MKSKVALLACTLFVSLTLQAPGQTNLRDHLEEGGFRPQKRAQQEADLIAGRAGSLTREGLIAAEKRQYDKALSLYTAALATKPNGTDSALIYDARAYTHLQKKDFTKVIADENEAIAREAKFARAYLNRGTAYRFLGDQQKAVADFNAAIKHQPDYDLAYSNLGVIYAVQGDYPRSLQNLSEAIRLFRDDHETFSLRATVHYLTGNYKKAEDDMARAVKLAPKNAFNLKTLAWLKATCPEDSLRDGKQAVETATKACGLTNWNDWLCIDVLAAAYAELGDFEKAMKYQQQALTGKNVPAAWTKYMQQRLALYRQGKPFRDFPKLSR